MRLKRQALILINIEHELLRGRGVIQAAYCKDEHFVHLRVGGLERACHVYVHGPTQFSAGKILYLVGGAEIGFAGAGDVHQIPVVQLYGQTAFELKNPVIAEQLSEFAAGR